ncbi:RDD family protein [Luteimonas fraxinea]|uniref:RDD family protein n=1 Tax=Luteimonas fraxinea TaxID=2901869 RepID=A0ABS8UH74_9GAMM|nr:RDD family protein [Luteimonas fraxinea]MCD9098871.1 RDD family protein [Luteimonas fraxinea]MCD9125265.1 RDD family protein [Luteimonas fraxinea]UHH09071.1 RDD family protein [Luteimonas fraxinea]
MTDWYYADGRNTRHGPVTQAALLQLRQDGIVGDSTLIWRDGLADWQPFRELAAELGVAPAAGIEAWALEPVAPVATAVASDEAEASWRPLTATGAGDPGYAGSPYAPPTANVARPDAVTQGGDVVLAGFLKRVAAYAIDAVIVGIASAVVGGLIYELLGVGGFGRGFWLEQAVINAVSLVLSALYFAWFHAAYAMATPGKMAVGIKVVRLDGARISFLRGIGRYFATILSSLILMIGFLMAGFTQRKQALHDMVCDTLVVDRWAFTDRPELQRRELGTVTVVVLVLVGILIGLGLLGLLALVGFAAFS